MGAAFFNGWPMWEKMTFVLACAIVATIALGCCKLWYDHWRIRKYKSLGSVGTVRTSEMAQVPNREEEPEDIPFGIRALEKGVEVDGVWISRPNTPAPGSPVSCVSSLFVEPTTSQVGIGAPSDVPRLELPQSQQNHTRHSRSSSRAPSSSFDRAVSAERLSSRSSSPQPWTLAAEDHHNQRPQSLYSYSRPQSSYSRPTSTYSRDSSYDMTRETSTLTALKGFNTSTLNSVQVPSASKALRTSSESSRQSSSGSDNSAHSAPTQPHVQNPTKYNPAYLSPDEAQNRTNDLRTSLDLLHSHRLSHVAETGQLTPRVRRHQPNNSVEWANSVLQAAKIENADYFTPQPPSPSSSPPSSPLPNPFSTPSHSATTITEPTTPVSNIHIANNNDSQGEPLFESYHPGVPQRDIAQPYVAQPYTAPPDTTQPKETLPQPNPTHPPPFQLQRTSQVLRKVNSGFEILRPGTLSNIMPPLGSEDGNGGKRVSRRLQKKRRSSSSSEHRISSFIEQV